MSKEGVEFTPGQIKNKLETTGILPRITEHGKPKVGSINTNPTRTYLSYLMRIKQYILLRNSLFYCLLYNIIFYTLTYISALSTTLVPTNVNTWEKYSSIHTDDNRILLVWPTVLGRDVKTVIHGKTGQLELLVKVDPIR